MGRSPREPAPRRGFGGSLRFVGTPSLRLDAPARALDLALDLAIEATRAFIERPTPARARDVERRARALGWGARDVLVARWCEAPLPSSSIVGVGDAAFALASTALHIARPHAALTLLERSEGPSRLALWFNRGVARWRLGELEEARRCMDEARRSLPASTTTRARTVAEAREALDQHARACARRLGVERVQGPRLALQLLDPVHAAPLRAHQADPSIARRANMTRLAALLDAQRFVERQLARPGRLPLAVLHHRWGAIGFASLQRVDPERASVSYWLGAETHGQGLGTELVGLLSSLAEGQGIQELQASVLESNVASERILSKHGFLREDGEASGPSIELRRRLRGPDPT